MAIEDFFIVVQKSQKSAQKLESFVGQYRSKLNITRIFLSILTIFWNSEAQYNAINIINTSINVLLGQRDQIDKIGAKKWTKIISHLQDQIYRRFFFCTVIEHISVFFGK